VDSHTRAIGLGLVGAITVGLASFFVQVEVFSMGATRASEVFQPTVTIVALAVIAALFALGLRSEHRLGARAERALGSASDTSFGVYLAHPLVLQALVALGGALGLTSALGSTPSALQLLMVLAILVPVTLTVTALGMALIRRTPASLAVAGRRMSSPLLSRPIPA
jgi:surface polysaccharide O-acyltransferase-like enzyme